MRIATGKVVAGKVVIEGDPLEEGATVTVLAPEGEQSFEVTAEQEAALLASIEEADRGSSIGRAAVLRSLSGPSAGDRASE